MRRAWNSPQTEQDGDFAIHVLAGQPDLDVVGLLRGKAHVAGAERDDAVVQPEPPQDFLGGGQHALVLVLGLLRRGDGDELDLGELVLADHAAGVFAGGARFGAEARRAGGVAARQRVFVDDGFADEIGQRDFGGGNEPDDPICSCIFNSHDPSRACRQLGSRLSPIESHAICRAISAFHSSTSLNISCPHEIDHLQTLAIARCQTSCHR